MRKIIDHKGQHGFTIVELLVVVVVIAILASITIVSYASMQNRGYDTKTDAAVSALKKAIELYRAENGKYPSIAADGAGINPSGLGALLVPSYISEMPILTDIIGYVSDSRYDAYGFYVQYKAKPSCKTGTNALTSWWGSTLPMC